MIRSVLNNVRSGRYEFFIIWLVIGTTLFWLGVGSWYCYPNAEDLSVAVLAREKGIMPAALEVLVTYDGRYFTNILHGINPLAFDGYYGYKWMPAIAIAGFGLALFFLLKSVFPGRIKSGVALTIAFLITAIHLATVPSLPYHLYVMISGFVFMYPWIFIFLWIGAYVRFIHTNKSAWFFIAIVLLVLSNGLNEMFLALNGVLSMVLVFYSFFNKKRRYASTLLLLSYIASTLFFITSPGITHRFESFSGSRASVTVSDMLTSSLSDFVKTLYDWIVLQPIFVLAAAWTGFYFSKLIPEKFLSVKYSLAVLFCSLLLMYIMTMAYYIPMSVHQYPDRVYGSVQPLFFIAVIYVFASVISFFRTDNISWILCILLMIFFIAIPDNSDQIKEEYQAGILDEFKNTMDHNYRILTTKDASGHCWKKAEIKDISRIPNSISIGCYISPNRSSALWNHSYEKYFRKDEIGLINDTINIANLIR